MLSFTKDNKLKREIKYTTNNQICKALSIRKYNKNEKKPLKFPEISMTM